MSHCQCNCEGNISTQWGNGHMEERDASCGEILTLDKVQVVVTVAHDNTVVVLPEMAHVLQAQHIRTNSETLPRAALFSTTP
jgi:hypothetical protein